jgi:hypothetical protein
LPHCAASSGCLRRERPTRDRHAERSSKSLAMLDREGKLTGLFFTGVGLLRPPGQPRSHLKQELAVCLIELAEHAAELLEIFRVLAGGAPGSFLRGFPRMEFARLGGLCFIIKKLVQRDFESSGPFFQGLDVGNRVPILDAREIGPLQSRAIFNFALGQFFCLRSSRSRSPMIISRVFH